ncbi:hypothetical protein GY45DRAFT_1323756 [Cubamyces sp. BRFM 1775]|nr:hypothetical protein GY45DRAFT_1323756 [Cubamyces sp. BRFM 1775]
MTSARYPDGLRAKIRLRCYPRVSRGGVQKTKQITHPGRRCTAYLHQNILIWDRSWARATRYISLIAQRDSSSLPSATSSHTSLVCGLLCSTSRFSISYLTTFNLRY